VLPGEVDAAAHRKTNSKCERSLLRPGGIMGRTSYLTHHGKTRFKSASQCESLLKKFQNGPILFLLRKGTKGRRVLKSDDQQNAGKKKV